MSIYLIKQGFDGWFGNNRGTKMSRGHTNRHITKEKFFDFSWQEMGQYDVPAFYKQILKFYDQNQKIIYVGCSQGTTQMFAALSDPIKLDTRKLLTDHTEKVFQLSPIAYMADIDDKNLKYWSNYEMMIYLLTKMIGLFNLNGGFCLGKTWWGTSLQFVCNNLPSFCDKLVTIAGYNPEVDNIVPNIGVDLEHVPAGMSGRSIDHYAQLIHGGKNNNPIFRMYDFPGQGWNLHEYGQDSPPDYDIKSWTVPLVLIAGTEDKLGDRPNVLNLIDRIPKNGEYSLHFMQGWSHATSAIPKHPQKMFDIFDNELKMD